MERSKRLKFDRIGYWSEITLDIVREYATAYSTIFSGEQQKRFHHVYIDAFAGAGVHISKQTGEFIPGSPLNALLVNPPFREFYFIDLDGEKVAALKERSGGCRDVYVYEGDCNEILLKEMFPKVRFEHYRRGLCLLDPYGLHLNWEVLQKKIWKARGLLMKTSIEWTESTWNPVTGCTKISSGCKHCYAERMAR